MFGTTCYFKELFDLGEYPFYVTYHILVLKPHNADAEVFQESISLLVVALCRLGVVCSAVKLDRKLLQWTVEVQHVWSDTMLATKLLAAELASFQAIP